MKKRVPYGIASFRQLITEGYYFVDKTRYIRDLENFKAPVFLRSRRFGKSLWCSILEHYYDVRFESDFDKLFGATDIGKNPTPSHNKYLVLRFNFSKVSASSKYNELEQNFNAIVFAALERFAQNHEQQGDFSSALKAGNAAIALECVLTKLKGRQLFVVIDEYDNFTNTLITSNSHQLYTDVTTGDSFLRSFFKVIKAGIEEETIVRTFITGVLPVTMDDLTSGFNVAQPISFWKPMLNMLGFTKDEVMRYVDEVFADYGFDPDLKKTVLNDLKQYYDGYKLLPGSKESVYNSTVCSYYLSRLTIEGEIPDNKFDLNMSVDVNWIKRLARSNEKAKDIVTGLLNGETVSASQSALEMPFNKENIFEESHFPIMLYYLGLLTFVSKQGELGMPNLSVRRLFVNYYSELWDFRQYMFVRDQIVLQFRKTRDWSILFNGFNDKYLKMLPAQAYDQANENFFRSTFYILFSEGLFYDYETAVEVNGNSGRSDFEAVGKASGADPSSAVVAEFKYYTQKSMKEKFGKVLEEKDIADLQNPPEEVIAQINGYAADLQTRHPDKTIQKFIVCFFSTTGYKLFREPGTKNRELRTKNQELRTKYENTDCHGGGAWV